jgi:hypothetical protein
LAPDVQKRESDEEAERSADGGHDGRQVEEDDLRTKVKTGFFASQKFSDGSNGE